MNKLMLKTISIIAICSLVIGSLSGCGNLKSKLPIKTNPKVTVESTLKPTTNITNDYTENTELTNKLSNMIAGWSGKYSVRIDNYKTHEFVNINPQKIRAASVIKVFVMAAAFNKINKGELSLDTPITLKNREIEHVAGTGILQAQKAGYELSLEKTIELMISYSDNRAANIMVNLLGRDYINSYIQSIGMKDTHLGYYFYLTPPKGVTNTTSTNDLNKLFGMLYSGQCISPQYDKMMLSIMKKTVNKTKLCAKLPSEAVVAHKTGSVSNIEHDAGIVFSKKTGDFAISVMCFEVPNGQTTYTKISDVALTAYNYFLNEN